MYVLLAKSGKREGFPDIIPQLASHQENRFKWLT